MLVLENHDLKRPHNTASKLGFANWNNVECRPLNFVSALCHRSNNSTAK